MIVGGSAFKVMFTGIIERTIQVIGVQDRDASRQVAIARVWDDVKLGESIAINGVCLTVAQKSDRELGFDVIMETLGKTNLGLLRVGDDVNVERSLRVGERIDGHFVQGHVDGLGRLVKKLADQTEVRLTIETPDGIAKYLAPKGSICVDGVSLTIASVQGNQFDVALIPTTLSLTTLRTREPDWMFNLEADIISKQIVHYLEFRSTSFQKSK
jgi:riboflavin synthase